MPQSTLYWLTIISLGLCVMLSLLRRQTTTRLKTAQRQLVDERKDRERATSELVHVRSQRAAAEKEAEAAKKEAAAAQKEAEAAAEAKRKLEAIEADVARLERERDEARAAGRAAEAAQEETNRALEAKAIEGDVAQKTIAELARAAPFLGGASQQKITDVERQKKAAEDERAVAKKQLAESEAKLRERDAALAREVASAKESKEKAAALEAELTKAREEAAKAPPPPAAAASGGGGDFLAALDSDSFLNRGQKETIRGTYNQFTAKKRSS
ncbi:MAG TPA: hypothetical protein VM694_08160 [Polyangium sp.]|nr:hypothetical protein [Polyangium sp.]